MFALSRVRRFTEISSAIAERPRNASCHWIFR